MDTRTDLNGLSGGGEPGKRRPPLRITDLGYAAAALAVVLGWIVSRHYQLVNAFEGVGYWLGVAGASMMAILLLYPVRKRFRARFLGATKHWFRMHMILGVLGPVLILYHSNFQFGSPNSNVALICTLLVAGSGLIGRYLYMKIYADLAGRRMSLQELGSAARLTPVMKARASALAPHLIERMNHCDKLVLAAPGSVWASLLLPVKLAFTTRWMSLSLKWHARREIRRQAQQAGIGKVHWKRVQSSVCRMIERHLQQVRRVAEFHTYERLFSLWHIFHLPFFFLLVMAALMHVLAVHMYQVTG